MSKQRRTFSPEFKQQAACLVLDQGYSHMEASRSVRVGETVLRRWVQQLQMECQGVTPQGKAITPDQQRIQELEARIERLEREKAILKMYGLPQVCKDCVAVSTEHRLRQCIRPVRAVRDCWP